VIVRRATARLAAFALAFLIAVAVFWLVTDHNLFGTWYRCYRHQASFYAPQEVGATRTYWPWVALNPLEFAVAVGVPLFAAAVVGTAWLVARDAARPADRATDGTADDQGCGRQLAGVVFAWWLTLVALDLTGKNLGEIARLWMFLMPFAAVASAAVFERSKERRWPALALVALQAIQAMVFAAHVQGFFDPASVQL
jgi:cytochrome bd-type quinol oxidase subunit 2